MTDRLTIFLREFSDDVKRRLREFIRRLLRKLIEIAVTEMDLMGRVRDATSSVAFEAEHLKDSTAFKDPMQLYDWVFANIRVPDGLFLEFGVYKGDSINHFAKLTPAATWYGFDSIVGLPEAWTLGAKAGAFSVDGKLLAVRDNVRLIKGFFEDTLAGFVAERRGAKIALLHVDCDLYSSTRTILTSSCSTS
jgi:hypothetical protein